MSTETPEERAARLDLYFKSHGVRERVVYVVLAVATFAAILALNNGWV